MSQRVLVVSVLFGVGGPVALGGPLNLGFESGDFTSWVLAAGSAIDSAVVTDEFARGAGPDWTPQEGTFFASLWSTDSIGQDFSELSQDFVAGVGDTLSFDYFFDFGDVANFGANDRATASITGPSGTDVLFAIDGDSLGDFGSTGWNTEVYNVTEAGSYTLTFLVEEVDLFGFGSFESILGVDNLIYDPAFVIPLPHAAAMGLVGIGLIGCRRRNCRSAI